MRSPRTSARRAQNKRYVLVTLLGDGGLKLHYPLPLHLQKAYADLNLGEGAYPESEKAARECLSLPLYPELTNEQAARVADAVLAFR